MAEPLPAWVRVGGESGSIWCGLTATWHSAVRQRTSEVYRLNCPAGSPSRAGTDDLEFDERILPYGVR